MKTFNFKVNGTISIRAKNQQEADEKLNELLVEIEKIGSKNGGKLVF